MTENGQTKAQTISPQEDWNSAHDHAWRYFELHANQRMTMFNFFTVTVGLTVAGIASVFQGPQHLALVGVLLGIVLALLSFVFWKLDQRTAFLIKHAEAVQLMVERRRLPLVAQLFNSESAALAMEQADRTMLRKIWSYGDAFRVLFAVAALFGIVSAAVSGSRAVGLLNWETDHPGDRKADKGHPNVQAVNG